MASHKTGQELRVLTGTQDQVGNLVLMPDEMFHAIDTGARYIGAGPGGRSIKAQTCSERGSQNCL